MDIINDFLRRTYIKRDMESCILGKEMIEVRERAVCKDGYEVSIQATEYTYCSPRLTFKPNETQTYTAVELGFPNISDDLLDEYAEDPDEPTGTVYGYVPIELVVKLIEKHGGLVN